MTTRVVVDNPRSETNPRTQSRGLRSTHTVFRVSARGRSTMTRICYYKERAEPMVLLYIHLLPMSALSCSA